MVRNKKELAEDFITFRIQKEEKRLLLAKSRSQGYRSVSDYIRSLICSDSNIADMLKDIHDRICKQNIKWGEKNEL